MIFHFTTLDGCTQDMTNPGPAREYMDLPYYKAKRIDQGANWPLVNQAVQHSYRRYQLVYLDSVAHIAYYREVVPD